MSTFVKRNRYGADGDLWVKCDGCGHAEEVMPDTTDRLIVNEWIKENGWKTTKKTQRFIHLCPECIRAVEAKRREEFLNR